jgi:sec-independent protein translocase protein TatA
MFGLGVPELVLILIIGLVIFGPGRLPEIGKAMGKSMHEFKSAVNGLDTETENKPAETRTAARTNEKP